MRVGSKQKLTIVAFGALVFCSAQAAAGQFENGTYDEVSEHGEGYRHPIHRGYARHSYAPYSRGGFRTYYRGARGYSYPSYGYTAPVSQTYAVPTTVYQNVTRSYTVPVRGYQTVEQTRYVPVTTYQAVTNHVQVPVTSYQTFQRTEQVPTTVYRQVRRTCGCSYDEE